MQILLPVFNAADSLAACLASVLQHTPTNIPILLLDDASDDAATVVLLQATVEQHPERCYLHRREHNLGFVGNVNAALRESDTDVIVLNSDTVVYARWIEHLQRAAGADASIGIVCPVSDNATLLTVAASPMLADTSGEQLAALCEQYAGDELIELPTAAGFCMYIRHQTVRSIGLLDAAFTPGYGEEVDYSLRARAHGLRIVAAPRCFVSHRGSASFGDGDEIRSRRRLHELIVHERWPDYAQETRNWWRDNPLLELREALKTGAIKQRCTSARRVLHITHSVDSIGGTEVFVDGLLQRISPRYPATLMCVGQSQGWADQFVVDGHSELEVIKLNADYRLVNQTVQSQAADLSNPWIERYITRLLLQGDYAMVHVHYLIGWDSLLLPLLAHRLGLPVVVSLHCHYHLCPDYNMMLRPELVPCQQAYAGASKSCLDCLQPRYQARPETQVPPLPTYLQARRRFSTRALQAADAIIVPSQYLADAIANGLDPTLREKMQVIAHGVETNRRHSSLAAAPEQSSSATLQLLFCGGDYQLKGYQMLQVLITHAQQQGLDVHFHIAGECRNGPSAPSDSFTMHGALSHDLLLELMQKVDLLLLPSRYEESFSILLSEAWSTGVIPLASAHGALSDRITDGIDGYLLPPFEPPAWQQKLTWLASAAGRAALALMRDRLQQQPHRSMDDCSNDYLKLYQQLLQPAAAHANGQHLGQHLGQHDCSQQVSSAGPPLAAPKAADCLALHPPLPGVSLGSTLPELIVLIDCRRNHALRLAQTLASVRELAAVVVVLGAQAHHHTTVQDNLHCLATTDVTAMQTLIAQHPTAWLVWVESGDLLQASCRDWLAAAAQQHTDVIYANHDHVSASEQFYAPALKPDHDLAIMQYQPVLLHGLFVRADFWRRSAAASLLEAEALSLANQAIAQQAGREQNTVLHLPQILFHRLDQNIAADCRLGQRHDLLQTLKRHGLVNTGSIESVHDLDMGWTLQRSLSRKLRVHVCIWALSEQAHAAVLDNWQAMLSNANEQLQLTLETILPGALPVLPGWPQCDYLLHVHDGIRGLTDSSLCVLLSFAEQHQASAVAPQLRLASGSMLPIAYSACSSGLYRSLTQRMLKHGLHATAMARPASLHADVLADCVLLNCQHFRQSGASGGAAAHSKNLLQQWPQLPVSTRLAAYPVDCNALAVGAVSLLTSNAPEPLQNRSETRSARPRYLPDPWRWQVESGRRPGQQLDHRDRCSRRYRPASNLPVISSVVNNAWAAAQYRVIQPLQALLAESSIEQHHLHQLDQRPAPDAFAFGLVQTDVLLCLHWLNDHALQQLQLASQRLPMKIVLLIDDLLTDLPDYNPYARLNPADIADRLQHAAALADRIIVTSNGLATAYAGLHDDLRVIHNALPEQPWCELGQAMLVRNGNHSERASNRLRVGWAGGAQHDGDLAILEPVMQASASTVDWIVLGHCPPRIREHLAECHAAVDFIDYPQALCRLELDVAVAPLLDNPFNRCKSMLKILEYAALGLPVIASRVGCYADTPALAVDNNSADWTDAIMRYQQEPGLRHRHGAQMQAWLQQHHLLSRQLPQWRSAITQWK